MPNLTYFLQRQGGGPGARSGWDAPEHAECDDCTPIGTNPAFLPCVAQPCLFNLSADPHEYYDIAAEQPALLSKMQAKYNKYKKTAVGYPGNLHRLPLFQSCFLDVWCSLSR